MGIDDALKPIESEGGSTPVPFTLNDRGWTSCAAAFGRPGVDIKLADT
jgi:hypothetical protein